MRSVLRTFVVVALGGATPRLASAQTAAETATPAVVAPALAAHANLTLRVPDPIVASRAIAGLANARGYHLERRTDTEVVLLVPFAEAKEARALVGSVGAELTYHAEVRDVSDMLADLAAALVAAHAARARIASFATRNGTIAEKLRVERELAEAEAHIADLERDQARVRREVTLLRLEIALSYDAPTPEVVPEVVLPFAWLDGLGLGGLPPGSSNVRQRRVVESILDMGLALETPVLIRPGDAAFAVGPAMRSRGLIEADPVGIAVGFDLALAGGEGLVHDLDFLLGAGVGVSRWLALGLVSGASGSAWSGRRVWPAWQIPAELFASADLGDAARVLLQARPQWIPKRIEARQNGSSIGFADELVLRATLAIAPLAGSPDLEQGALRLGVSYHDLRGADLLTVSVGWGAGFTEYRHLDD